MQVEHPRWSKAVVSAIVALSVMAGCGPDAVEQPLAVTGSGESPASQSLRNTMSQAGCVPRVGLPEYGTIGLPSDSGHDLFTCKGIEGATVRDAFNRHRENRRAEVLGVAYNMGGFTIRHFLGSQEYCDQWVRSFYEGDKLLGRWVTWTNDCVTVSYYWDEWVPGGSGGDDYPGPSGGGGGPYYPPDSPNSPRIDTIPDYDHDCDLRDDIKCYQPLTVVDDARIKDSLFVFIKDPTTISDPTQRADCDSARAWFDYAVWKELIFRGRTDSFFVANGVGYKHDSQAYLNPTGVRGAALPLHIDPRHLDGAHKPVAKRALLQMIYHEVGHAVKGLDHSDDSVHAAAGYPGTPYFSTIANGACFQ